MSEGNQTPAGWPQQPAQPGPAGPSAPGGGFGPPPASYGPPQPSSGRPPVPGQQQAGPPWNAAAQQPAPPAFAAPGAELERPDWEAMADAHEVQARKRTRARVAVWSLVGLVLVGGVVATAVVLTKDKKPSHPVTQPTSPASPVISAGPKPTASTGGGGDDPSKPLWDAATDSAPITADSLFPEQTVTVNGATWTKTAGTVTQPCWDATTGGLGSVLGDQACRQVVRVTYVSGNSAVTLGIAVFDHKIQADNSLKNYKGSIMGLSAQGSPQFCITVGCTNTHGTLGRYGYMTVEGSAKPGGTAPDGNATAAASGFDDYMKKRLMTRAKSS